MYHQVYANPRESDVPLVDHHKTMIGYARNKLKLDRIDHSKLSNGAILNMSFPRRNRFVSDSSTNITDRSLHAAQNLALSPNPSHKQYQHKQKVREHNLKFVSAKDLTQAFATASSD